MTQNLLCPRANQNTQCPGLRNHDLQSRRLQSQLLQSRCMCRLQSPGWSQPPSHPLHLCRPSFLTGAASSAPIQPLGHPPEVTPRHQPKDLVNMGRPDASLHQPQVCVPWGGRLSLFPDHV